MVVTGNTEKSSQISSAGALWVIQPMEMTSTPEAATSRIVTGVMPPVRNPATGMGPPEPKTTGDVRIQNTGYDLEGTITVTQDLPGPTHLLSIFGTVSVYSG